jgi:hypothetical protein
MFFSWIISINKVAGRNIAVSDCTDHLYSTEALLYLTFCYNLYGTLAFLAVELAILCQCRGRKRKRGGGGRRNERLNILQMLLLSVVWYYHNGSLSVLLLCLVASMRL